MKQLLTTGPGLLIGIPTLGRPVPLDWALAFKALSPPINFNVQYSIIRGQEVGRARNEFAKQALSVGAKYLFMLGDDVEVPAHTLKQLLFRMENTEDIDVVGGVYCSKCEPPAPLVFVGDGSGTYWDWKVGEFFQCTGMGMDCTLIRTEVFKKLSEPWFKTVDEDKYLDGINSAEAWTEDLYFFKKLREELPESKVYCDASIICAHHDVYGNKKYGLPANSYPTRQKAVNKDKKCLFLGPEIPLEDETYDTVTANDSGDYRVAFNNLPFDENSFDWIVVTQPMDKYDHHTIKECLRVSKTKVSICLSELINPRPFQNLIRYNFGIETTVDGNYVEIVK